MIGATQEENSKSYYKVISEEEERRLQEVRTYKEKMEKDSLLSEVKKSKIHKKNNFLDSKEKNSIQT